MHTKEITLKSGFKENLIMLSDLFLALFIYFGFVLFLHYYLRYEVLLILFIIFIILSLPVVLIHLNHFKYTKNKKLLINNSEIRIIRGLQTKVIPIDNIKEIVFYISKKTQTGTGPIHLPFENYFYGVIKTMEGENFVISCLFSNRLHTIISEFFKNVIINYDNEFYPLVKDVYRTDNSDLII